MLITMTCPLRGIKKQTALINADQTKDYSIRSFKLIFDYLTSCRQQITSEGRIIIEVTLTQDKATDITTTNVNKGIASQKAANARLGTSIYYKTQQSSTSYKITYANQYPYKGNRKYYQIDEQQVYREISIQMFSFQVEALDATKVGITKHNLPQFVKNQIYRLDSREAPKKTTIL